MHLNANCLRNLKMPNTAHSTHKRLLFLAPLCSLTLVAAMAFFAVPTAQAQALQTVVVKSSSQSLGGAYEGLVEAVRQTTLAAQVPASIEQVAVKVGDRVKAGQVLVRLDARAAHQGTLANQAQVGAAKAGLDAATRELERKRQLVAKNYISQAALEQAEAQYKVAKAQVEAQSAQVGVSLSQAGFYQVLAPYAGIVSAVSVEKGDMAMPGRALVSLYDPSRLRVTAAIPVTAATTLQGQQAAQIELEIPGLPSTIHPKAIELLPTVDPQSLTRQLRAEVGAEGANLVPGMFARVLMPAQVGAPNAVSQGRVQIPLKALVRRSEMVGVYVVNAQGKALLRQVRLGSVRGDEVEVLAGLQAGERIATEPQRAARQP